MEQMKCYSCGSVLQDAYSNSLCEDCFEEKMRTRVEVEIETILREEKGYVDLELLDKAKEQAEGFMCLLYPGSNHTPRDVARKAIRNT